jgi:hypothetical protein
MTGFFATPWSWVNFGIIGNYFFMGRQKYAYFLKICCFKRQQVIGFYIRGVRTLIESAEQKQKTQFSKTNSLADTVFPKNKKYSTNI